MLKILARISLVDMRVQLVFVVLLALVVLLLVVAMVRRCVAWTRRGATFPTRALWFLAGACTSSACFGVVLTACVWVVIFVWKPFPDAIPWRIWGSAAVALAAIIFAVRRPHSIARAWITIPAAAFSLVGCLILANAFYQQYPTMRSLIPEKITVSMTVDDVEAAAAAGSVPTINHTEVGAVVSMDIDPVESGFSARTALAYVPPAYFRGRRDLPVVVLLAGNPGSPSVWLKSGEVESVLNDYQSAHGGVAPIVVSADGTGSFTGNPACVDSPGSNVQTYLAKDVPAGIRSLLGMETDSQHWTIGGLSYGGTCAFQIVTNYPDVYHNFLDFSGQSEPTIGKHEDTVNRFFDGDEDAFEAVNPKDILERAIADTPSGATPPFNNAGIFVAGTKDKDSKEALTMLNDLAKAAGMTTDIAFLEGGHSFQVWRPAFRCSLPFIMGERTLGATESTSGEQERINWHEC